MRNSPPGPVARRRPLHWRTVGASLVTDRDAGERNAHEPTTALALGKSYEVRAKEAADAPTPTIANRRADAEPGVLQGGE